MQVTCWAAHRPMAARALKAFEQKVCPSSMSEVCLIVKISISKLYAKTCDFSTFFNPCQSIRVSLGTRTILFLPQLLTLQPTHDLGPRLTYRVEVVRCMLELYLCNVKNHM